MYGWWVGVCRGQYERFQALSTCVFLFSDVSSGLWLCWISHYMWIIKITASGTCFPLLCVCFDVICRWFRVRYLRFTRSMSFRKQLCSLHINIMLLFFSLFLSWYQWVSEKFAHTATNFTSQPTWLYNIWVPGNLVGY